MFPPADAAKVATCASSALAEAARAAQPISPPSSGWEASRRGAVVPGAPSAADLASAITEILPIQLGRMTTVHTSPLMESLCCPAESAASPLPELELIETPSFSSWRENFSPVVFDHRSREPW